MNSLQEAVMKEFFKPKSVAVIGASKNPGKVGFSVVKNLKDSGFGGNVYCVNPNYSELMGYPCFKSIESLPQTDLAVLVVPPKACIDAVAELGKRGTKAVIVISAGFGETKDGKYLEKTLLEVAKKFGVRLIGPNCLGVMDTHSKLNATFAKVFPPKGNVAVVSQSGALLSAFFDWAIDEKVGFSKVVSLGNQIDVSVSELIEFLGDDPETNAILLYLEGLKDGKDFMRAAYKVSGKKPIIAIKVGRTKAGMKAASSHTGSMAGSDQAFDAAFRKVGVLRVKSMEELFDIAKLISVNGIRDVANVAIVTNAGGPGIIASDAIEESTLKLANLSEETVRRLMEKLPPMANFYNPIDVIGDADSSRYEYAIKCVIEDKNVDVVLVLLTPQLMTDIAETAKVITKFKGEKPIVTSFIGRHRVLEGIEILKTGGIPNFPFPERAVKALDVVNRYFNEVKFDPSSGMEMLEFVKEKISGLIHPGKIYPEYDSLEILKNLGINVPKAYLTKTIDEALEVAENIGYPIVAKVYSIKALHKTDVKGVIVGIGNRDELIRAYNSIVTNFKERFNELPEGIVLEEMVDNGVDVIVGFKRDEIFGSITLFGLGGVFVEVLKDVAIGISPVSKKEALYMIDSIKSSVLLKGKRTHINVDFDRLAEIINLFSLIPIAIPYVEEGEVNPLRITQSGKIVALDARFITVKPT